MTARQTSSSAHDDGMPSPYGQPPGFDTLSEEELAQEKGTTGYDLPELEKSRVDGHDELEDGRLQVKSASQRYLDDWASTEDHAKTHSWMEQERASRRTRRRWILLALSLGTVFIAALVFWIAASQVNKQDSTSALASPSTTIPAAANFDWDAIMSRLSSIKSQYSTEGRPLPTLSAGAAGYALASSAVSSGASGSAASFSINPSASGFYASLTRLFPATSLSAGASSTSLGSVASSAIRPSATSSASAVGSSMASSVLALSQATPSMALPSLAAVLSASTASPSDAGYIQALEAALQNAGIDLSQLTW